MIGLSAPAAGQSWFEQLLDWREKHISERTFVLMLAFAVGFFCAVAAFTLHWIIAQIALLLTSSFNEKTANWLYLVYPVVGIYLTGLFVKYVVKDNISHGITRILYAISSKRSRLRGHNCWSSVLASAITIGFGGSVGAEAPIVLTGSAIGSNLGKLFRMDNRTLVLLVGCGAAGAIAGIFKAPIAGLVFTLLGVTCGLLSLYFIRAMTLCEDMFSRFKDKPYFKLVIGGSMLSMLIFLFPSLYGEGYHDINQLLNGSTEADWNGIMHNSLFSGHGSLLVIYVFLVVVTKVFATSATNGGGGCGGTFAPSLFVGCFGGFLFARLWNMYEVGVYVPEKNFALLGMAGVMSGVMHAPLTGIFLIAEITGGYALFLPLMIVSVCSYLTIIIFEPHSIYGMRLAREGKLITHHTDHAVLTLMSLDSVIDRDYTPVSPDMELGTIVHKISRSRNIFLPVLDAAGNLLGEIYITKIRHVVFRIELYHHFTASQLMTPPAATLRDDEPMTEVMQVFDRTHADWLPVLDADGHLKGYISRQRMYGMYRKMVADMSED